MARRNLLVLSLLLVIGAGHRAGAEESVPDEAGTRHQVDTLIAAAPNHRATLGTLQGAMELSISFGAPAWNLRDHDACCRFYVKTGESLVAAFAAADHPDRATPPARAALEDVTSALD